MVRAGENPKRALRAELEMPRKKGKKAGRRQEIPTWSYSQNFSALFVKSKKKHEIWDLPRNPVAKTHTSSAADLGFDP